MPTLPADTRRRKKKKGTASAQTRKTAGALTAKKAVKRKSALAELQAEYGWMKWS